MFNLAKRNERRLFFFLFKFYQFFNRRISTAALILFSFNLAASPLVYLTIQDDPTTNMSIHGIVDQGQHLQFYYKKADSKRWKMAHTRKELLHFPSVDYYVAHVSELSPATTYDLTWDKKKVYQFRTVDPSKMRFLVGGDVKINKKLLQVNQTALKQDPDFVVLCGDIGYSELRGDWVPFYQSSYPHRLLSFLRIWSDTMTTSSNRFIPLLCAIGNHDVKGMFHQPKENAKLFYELFFAKKVSYRKISTPKVDLVLLDSGHTEPVDGDQIAFLNQKLNNQKNHLVFYHVSCYPSTRRSSKYSRSIRDHWVPIFEQNKVPFAFEHHDHSLKRTYAIRENRKDQQGIVFLGDGAWSVSPRGNRKRWYLHSTHAKNGFWMMDVTKDTIKATAVDATGQILDQTSKNL